MTPDDMNCCCIVNSKAFHIPDSAVYNICNTCTVEIGNRAGIVRGVGTKTVFVVTL